MIGKAVGSQFNKVFSAFSIFLARVISEPSICIHSHKLRYSFSDRNTMTSPLTSIRVSLVRWVIKKLSVFAISDASEKRIPTSYHTRLAYNILLVAIEQYLPPGYPLIGFRLLLDQVGEVQRC